ncbi:hypothetical protein PVAND_014556 [Polypedilum vanderplanki]|uniref:Secreted protein n=1 Tax=Polypedilum vanderplanki TaxID=319348 RepID=A0A9J6BAC4_POLVA|nr:hypothetical protein PVAND_014556 [Polypedilum vanderplanki]
MKLKILFFVSAVFVYAMAVPVEDTTKSKFESENVNDFIRKPEDDRIKEEEDDIKLTPEQEEQLKTNENNKKFVPENEEEFHRKSDEQNEGDDIRLTEEQEKAFQDSKKKNN